MNSTKASAIELAKGIAKGAPKSGVEVGVAPPFVYLDVVSQAIAGSSVLLGAQDAFYEKSGAFTGEMLRRDAQRRWRKVCPDRPL